MFCLFFAVLFFFHFFLARFIVLVSIVSVCESSIVATCPLIPAARFAFCLYFILFVSIVRSCFSGEPKQNQGRGLMSKADILSTCHVN